MLEALKNVLLYGGSFIFVLGMVVFVHEFGHFRAARLCRIAVKSFSIGMGPAVAQARDRHGTTWKLGAIPIGGFVSWVDDTDPSSIGPATEEAQQLSHEEARERGHFRAAPVAARAFVVVAGPLMNFVFAIAAFAAVVLIVGRDMTDRAQLSPRIDGVMANSAAEKGGIRGGDVVVEIQGQPVSVFGDFQRVVAANPERQLNLVVRRDGGLASLTVTPTATETPGPDGRMRRIGLLGIERRTLPEERVIERVGPIGAIGIGAQQTWSIVAMTGAYIGEVFAGRASPEHIAGPAGILNESGRIASRAIDQTDVSPWERLSDLLLSLLQWAAILSVAVGIVNLLPIPILDGGHLLFYAIEAIRGGKPLPPQAHEWALRAGLAVLGGLFLFATWNDIQRFLNPGIG
ncbi:MAG: RIP metalloprotease [Hyphomonadaceae bacterium]|nr:RIP metalloprotease [Hyphomonadaceae bacterium]